MNYSLEHLKEKIHNKNTKEYFNEVYRSFANGNYRSAIVFLYSVVLYDLYAKLEELHTVHEDDNAKEILQYINNMREKKQTSSQWEKELIDRIYKQTNLLNNYEREDINFLKQKRNSCAHPTIDNDSLELYKPDVDTIRGLLFNMLEAIFIKPPFFTNDVTNKLVEDLATRNNSGYSDAELESLIINRYLKHLSEKKQEKVLKDLWKFVFKLTNEDAVLNRKINFQALKIYYANADIDCFKFIRDNNTNFSVNKTLTRDLIEFLRDSPNLYKVLDETTKTEINTVISQNKTVGILAHFSEDSFDLHLNKIRDLYGLPTEDSKPFINHELNEMNREEAEALCDLKEVANQHNANEEYISLIIDLYTKSPNYNEADLRFEMLIGNLMDEFPIDTLKSLVFKIQYNNQCYLRGRARRDHKIIEDAIRKYEPDYELPELLT